MIERPWKYPTGPAKVWFLIRSLWPTTEHRDRIRRTRRQAANARRYNSLMMRFVLRHEGEPGFLRRADEESARLRAELDIEPDWAGGDYAKWRLEERAGRVERWRTRLARFMTSNQDAPDFADLVEAERHTAWRALGLDGEPEQCRIER